MYDSNELAELIHDQRTSMTWDEEQLVMSKLREEQESAYIEAIADEDIVTDALIDTAPKFVDLLADVEVGIASADVDNMDPQELYHYAKTFMRLIDEFDKNLKPHVDRIAEQNAIN